MLLNKVRKLPADSLARGNHSRNTLKKKKKNPKTTAGADANKTRVIPHHNKNTKKKKKKKP